LVLAGQDGLPRMVFPDLFFTPSQNVIGNVKISTGSEPKNTFLLVGPIFFFRVFPDDTAFFLLLKGALKDLDGRFTNFKGLFFFSKVRMSCFFPPSSFPPHANWGSALSQFPGLPDEV